MSTSSSLRHPSSLRHSFWTTVFRKSIRSFVFVLSLVNQFWPCTGHGRPKEGRWNKESCPCININFKSFSISILLSIDMSPARTVVGLACLHTPCSVLPNMNAPKFGGNVKGSSSNGLVERRQRTYLVLVEQDHSIPCVCATLMLVRRSRLMSVEC
jgi:hypothetical protein